MRRLVIIVPELLGEPSVLRQSLPTLARVTELGELFKLSPLPDVETPEALYLGLSPGEGQLRQGPLTVAALGADPPDRSTHFHISLMSCDDSVAHAPKVQITADEQREIMQLAKKLNTNLLTIVEGEGLDHGLVWESLGDLGTTATSQVDGKTIRGYLPEGDGEVILRRFIDDSVNLLSEIELNVQRRGDDLPLLNLLWPWGHGVRLPLPNLALRRGAPAMVFSTSMRLQGLSRIAGYRHFDRRALGRGLNLRLAKIAEQALSEDVSIVGIEAVARFRAEEKLEEAEWFVHELDHALLKPVFEKALLEPTNLTLLAPGSGPGLGVSFATEDAAANVIPFDERALDERTLSNRTLWEAVGAGL